VEFLEYLTPQDGRPAPADTRPNDLVHWQTILAGKDAEAVARAVREGGCALLSDVLAPADSSLGVAKTLRLRDPDGHALRLIEP
jgi:predicted enzyme related to lactoylglutathione lyase